MCPAGCSDTRTLVESDRLAITEQSQIGVGAEPDAVDRLAGRGDQVVSAAGPAVVGVAVGDDRPLDGPPGVDVKVAGRAVEAVVGGDEERGGHD